MTRVQVWAWALMCTFAHSAPSDIAMRQLKGPELRKQLVGHEVTDGARWTDRYGPDGKAEGHALGKTYTGTWTIEDDEVCLTRAAKRRRTECFEVWSSGSNIEYRWGSATLATGSLRNMARAGPLR